MAKLKGKSALVTGGSRGIGAAIAERLAQEGADVAITYSKSADAAEKVVARGRAYGVKAEALQADSGDGEPSSGSSVRSSTGSGALIFW